MEKYKISSHRLFRRLYTLSFFSIVPPRLFIVPPLSLILYPFPSVLLSLQFVTFFLLVHSSFIILALLLEEGVHEVFHVPFDALAAFASGL